MSGAERITHLLNRLGEDEAAGDRLFSIVYGELHREAERLMAGQNESHTLQASALVNEAYLKLVGAGAGWESRRHFFAVAVRAMRSVLIDHSRTKRRKKRYRPGARVFLEDVVRLYEEKTVDLLDLDQALGRLEDVDPEAAKIVELRFFGGLSVSEVSEITGIPLRTTERNWEFARSWLRKTLA